MHLHLLAVCGFRHNASRSAQGGLELTWNCVAGGSHCLHHHGRRKSASKHLIATRHRSGPHRKHLTQGRLAVCALPFPGGSQL